MLNRSDIVVIINFTIVVAGIQDYDLRHVNGESRARNYYLLNGKISASD